MNSVQLVGRFTRDPEIRYTDNGTSIARFSVAVERKYKSENGENADFINCIAFGKTAEFIEKYFSKGQRIGLNGRIQTGSYMNQEGQKIYTTDVIAESVEFVESKGSGQQGENTSGRVTPDIASNDGFMNIPDGINEELPFN